LGHSKTDFDKATRLFDVALILRDSGEYEEAGKKLREVAEGYERLFGRRTPTYADSRGRPRGNIQKSKEVEGGRGAVFASDTDKKACARGGSRRAERHS